MIASDRETLRKASIDATTIVTQRRSLAMENLSGETDIAAKDGEDALSRICQTGQDR